MSGKRKCGRESADHLSLWCTASRSIALMTQTTVGHKWSDRAAEITIVAILIAYGAAAAVGLPQRGTELTNAPAGHAAHEAGEAEEEVHSAPPTPPGVLMVLPFALLFGAIAVLPLIPATEHWWDSNLHRFYVAAGLGLLTLGYYAVVHAHPVEGHFLGHSVVAPAASGVSWGATWTIFQNAIFNEFAHLSCCCSACTRFAGVFESRETCRRIR